MLSWLGLARKAAEKQSGSLVKPSNQTGAAMPRNQPEKVMDNNMLRIQIITKAGTTSWIDYLEIDQNWIDQMIAQEIPVAFQSQDENGKIGIKTGIVAAVLN